jgi:hypothetical protein
MTSGKHRISVLTLNPTSRRRPSALTLAVLLGCAVFLWGLGYKLSLYQPVVSRHSEPAARLLSQKERPVPVLHLDRLFRSGKALHHPGPQTFAPTDLARLDPIHLAAAAAAAPRALTRPSTPLSQQPSRITRSTPRAPPASA